jgi:copper(I)-binding protein
MWRTWVLLAGLVIGLAACGGGSGTISVVDAWSAPTPPTARVAAVYVSIENDTGADDAIVSASTDRCGRVELHATQIDENNVMTMRPAGLELLTIPSGGVVEMMPGGLHIMCLDLREPLVAGETIPLAIVLASGTTLSVDVPVEQR